MTMNDTLTNVEQSLTASVKKMFYTDSEGFAPLDSSLPPNEPEDVRPYESVFTVAQERGQTLQEFVEDNPARAVRLAEMCLAYWVDLLSTVAINGMITTSNGESIAVSKNQTKLIELRVNQASKHLEIVNKYSFIACQEGEQKKDHLIRSLYTRAINGDTKAATYLIDRVEGRPSETKVADLDYDNAYNIYMIIHTLFDKQLEVINSGNGTILACCSRRAGKTRLLVALLLIEALRRPNTCCIYIGETMELSLNLIDSAVNEIIEACQLRDKKGKRFNWKKMDNGSQILVRGLSNTKDPDQIRGNKAKVIVIDEFFHLKSELLEYLQREVLQPMQMDYADDYKFICAGTPPSIKGTYAEYAWKHWEVPHFTWTWEDNPHPVDVEKRREYVENVLKEKGLDWSAPFARREYRAEWVYDEDLILYPEYHTYNPREQIPSYNVDMILFGIDYGVSDNDTLIGIAWDTSAARGYVFWETKFNRLDIKDRTISQLEYLRGEIKAAWQLALEFFPSYSPKDANKRILWDADDNDQHLTDDLNINVRLENYPELRLNIQNAHKTDKVIMFDKIRDLLRTAGLLLIEDGKTAHECDSTILKRGPNGEVYPEVDYKAYHPDLLPAMRYCLWNVLGNK